jgi:hypothetical protein
LEGECAVLGAVPGGVEGVAGVLGVLHESGDVAIHHLFYLEEAVFNVVYDFFEVIEV